MPENTNTWIQVVTNLPKEWIAVLMAMFISVLRILYDKEETNPMRILLEMLLCGSLSFTANYGLAAMGLAADSAVFVGGCIGYFGSVTVRGLAIKMLDKKLDKEG